MKTEIVEKFKRGDVVQLISGGPPMTVENYVPGLVGIVTCVWFDPASSDNFKLRHISNFYERTLKAANEF